ncbi:hypothetical protein B0J15DRAFT_133048 [Fusarium solani]|uniref:Secreted protein n=1 Tax=Fusarium solani TaxID=169388 RepID=A0A9P9L5D7_FUSSL|nr:uncharacterized protein B0J15DRAFT_133048 [Fusarium solani]KAH7274532.1 hypothetical protein B0J15DRAFT_133048 [Fusarium solani]
MISRHCRFFSLQLFLITAPPSCDQRSPPHGPHRLSTSYQWTKQCEENSNPRVQSYMLHVHDLSCLTPYTPGMMDSTSGNPCLGLSGVDSIPNSGILARPAIVPPTFVISSS